MTKSRGLREHHGKRHTKVYAAWCGMRGRCLNPSNPAFPSYGGRGITVSDAWSKFSRFYHDMGDPPTGGMLERVDNNKGYSAENCRWATRTEQNRNKRSNIFITIEGETAPLSVWAERRGLKYQTVWRRIIIGWTPEHAVTTPLVTKRKGVPRGQRIAVFETKKEAADKGGPDKEARINAPVIQPTQHKDM